MFPTFNRSKYQAFKHANSSACTFQTFFSGFWDTHLVVCSMPLCTSGPRAVGAWCSRVGLFQSVASAWRHLLLLLRLAPLLLLLLALGLIGEPKELAQVALPRQKRFPAAVAPPINAPPF